MVIEFMKDKIQEYRDILRKFVDDEIDAIEFETKYLNLYKTDTTKWQKGIVSILYELFSDVDAFCSDPELRDEEDLDENQLKECVVRALKDLDSY